MSDRSKKKEKHRLKREKKRLAARKNNSVSPLSLLKRGEGELYCMITKNWEKEGIAAIYILATVGGRSMMAGFLIDAWCVGLKDAFGERNFSRVEFNDLIKRASAQVPLVEIDKYEAADFVKAAIYFSGKNGFSLPAGWAKWAAVFGPMDLNHDVDLSRFGKDGKLLYVGSESFLRRRLRESTVEQFMARPDVDVLFRADPGIDAALAMDDDGDDDEDFESDGEDEDETDYDVKGIVHEMSPQLGPVFLNAINEMTTKVNDELQRRHVAPHPRLKHAIVYIASLAVTGEALLALGMAPPTQTQTEEALNDLMTKNREPDRASLWEAISQVRTISDNLILPPALSVMQHLPH